MSAVVNSFADDAGIKTHFIDFYERLAFAGVDKKMVRFYPQPKFSIDLICFSSSCGELAEKIKLYVPQSIFEIPPTQNYNAVVPISLVILSENQSSENQNFFNEKQFELRPGETIFKDVSKECASFSILAGHEVRKIVVVSGNSTSWQKSISCAIVQLVRGSGLAFADTFDKLWPNGGGGLATMDAAAFDANLLTLGRLLALHFNGLTKPSMTVEEFESSTQKLELRDLTGGLQWLPVLLNYSYGNYSNYRVSLMGCSPTLSP